jgi:hypothetical protein
MLNKNPRNQMLNKSRGFGFVTFEDASSVELVLHAAQTQQHYIDGKLVRLIVQHIFALLLRRAHHVLFSQINLYTLRRWM